MRALRVEVAMFTVRGGRLETALLRGRANTWRLPGMAVGSSGTLREAAEAALAEETGVRHVELEQLFTFDREGGEGAAVTYLALLHAGAHPLAPGSEVVEVRWFSWDDIPELPPDQAETLGYGRERLRAKAAYAPVAAQLVPGDFTISELQGVYEAILGRQLDARNFRRDLISAGVVERLDRTRSGGPGRPASLYRWSAGAEGFSVLAVERRLARALSGDEGTAYDAE
ncbi:MAG: NUDIX hydrolase [Miltoncostaeaceae bacterium]